MPEGLNIGVMIAMPKPIGRGRAGGVGVSEGMELLIVGRGTLAKGLNECMCKMRASTPHSMGRGKIEGRSGCRSPSFPHVRCRVVWDP